VGALLLCAVREVKGYSLQVSLPFNIAATVHVTDISEPITSLAHRLTEPMEQGEVNNCIEHISTMCMIV